ncbi:MAG TPA: site-specific integrase [Gaiellales bacterium]|nr:site-specific integrase [Gaiellales bacterium]
MFGPLQPLVRGFLLELIELGYGWGPQTERLRLMAELSAWMAAEGIEPTQLTASLIGEFLAPLRAHGPRRGWFSPTSERQLVDYLRRLALVLEPEVPTVSDPVELLVGSFVEYLVRERGLAVASTSVYEYRRIAQLFLAGRVAPDRGLGHVTSGDVTVFVLDECRRRSYRMSQALVTSLRGLLRFLFLEGLTPTDLTGAVPGVAKWRAASLPRALRAGQVARILAGCDRRTAVGRRDFAVLIMLSRLGLRACEVARLRLEDLDWRAGELIVRGKQDRHERLPLPVDVGDALVEYLRNGRPARKDRHLFLTVRAPFRPLTGGDGAIGMLVRSACERAGLEPVGAHRLRHTVATEVLRAGAPLEEIASLLRHRRHATTVIYAKVDWERLRELARPWPGSPS